MATVVKMRNGDEHFVLLGTGLGALAAERVDWLYGDIEAEHGSTVISVVAVADAAGDVRWVPSDQLTVVSVDGQSPAHLIAGARAAGSS